jgi:zinc transporter
MGHQTSSTTATGTSNDGLVCAFRLSPPGPVDAAALDRDGASDDRPLWLHLNIANARARLWLQGQEDIPREAREQLLSSDRHVRADVIDGTVVAVLTDLRHDFHDRQHSDEDSFDTLRIYLDQRRVITTRHHALRTADRVRRELQASGGGPPRPPIALFEHFIEELSETLGALVTRLGENVDDAEDEILSGRVGRQGETLGRVRRTLARLRRQVNANRAALAPLPRRLGEGYDADQRQSLRHAIERLDGVAQDLELVQERARLVQEEIAGRLSEATNRNLFLLSIVTTTLLPITLITGVFGMNVTALPWTETPGGFWWVMLVMVVALIVTLVLLRRRRVL